MSETENTKNWALEELMNYVSSLEKNQTNASNTGSLNATMPEDETENYKNSALEELMNYLDLLAEDQTKTSYTGSSDVVKPTRDHALAEVNEVEVLNISRGSPQEINSKALSKQVEAKKERQAALSPSNMANLVALIQQLRSSNSNLVKRVTALSQAMTGLHQTLESHKVQSQVAESMLLEKNQALEIACQTIECQQNLIETLNAELSSHKEFVAQSQAIYSEQSYQLLEAKNTCKELRTRLHREQQHSLQLKFALEKCLATPAVNHQYVNHPTDLESDFVIPKAPPIQTWTVKTPCTNHEIELDWERQPATNSVNEADVVETNEQNTCPENAIASLEELLNQPLEDCDNEIIEVQWQELANLVENNLQDQAIANLTSDILAELDEEVVASPIETSYFNANKNWPSPVVYPSRPPKGRKSLAAIELPPFRRRA